MKFKYMLAFALVVFGASAGFNSVQAQDPECLSSCRQERRACLTYTPDKAALCEAAYTQCLGSCGVFN